MIIGVTPWRTVVARFAICVSDVTLNIDQVTTG